MAQPTYESPIFRPNFRVSYFVCRPAVWRPDPYSNDTNWRPFFSVSIWAPYLIMISSLSAKSAASNGSKQYLIRKSENNYFHDSFSNKKY